MEESDINTLINTALCTKNQDYMNPEGMELFKKNLEDKTKDLPALIIFLYFFPLNSSLEKNDKEFWFMKYKDVENYNEYEFAKDILQCYNQYLSDKSNEGFEYNILQKIILFKDYKFIAEFLGALKGHDAKIIAIISYIEKDPSYFEKAFETIIEPQKIQKKSCINKIKDYLERKNDLLNLRKSLQTVNYLGDLLVKEKTIKNGLINDIIFLKKEVIGLKKDNVALNGNITKLKIDNVALNGNITKLKIDNATLNGNITKLQNDNATLNGNITKLQNDNMTLYENNTILNENITKLQNDNVTLNENNMILNEKITKLEKDKETLNEDISKMKKGMSELKDRLDQIDTRDL